jgi:hypothetical protein
MTKTQCVKANADGQALRLDGKLTEARAQLEACGDPTCPAMVVEDCVQRLKDLERAQPTIVFDVKDATGADVSAVRVSVDGQMLVEKLDGAAIRIDVGEHVFTFTPASGPPVTRHLVIKEGEKDRRERVLLGGESPAPAATTPQPSAGSSLSTRKLVGLLTGGAGVAGILLGSVYGLETFSAVSQQKSDCPLASGCANARDQALAQAEHATVTTDGAVSTASFIVGGALVAAGAYLFFAGPSAPPHATTGLTVVPSAGPGSGAILVHGTF